MSEFFFLFLIKRKENCNWGLFEILYLYQAPYLFVSKYTHTHTMCELYKSIHWNLVISILIYHEKIFFITISLMKQNDLLGAAVKNHVWKCKRQTLSSFILTLLHSDFHTFIFCHLYWNNFSQGSVIQLCCCVKSE